MAEDREGDMERPTGPLAGIRIVEFAGIGPGPYAAMLLADMGADIVRIDRPGGADSYARKVLYRGRSTLVADLKDSTQRDDIMLLLQSADALIEGFRPGVMEKFGLGPDIVLERNPRLVYGRMTGWGQDGPRAETAGHDINYIAITGALAAIGTRERPVVPLNLLGDFGGGSMFLVCGLLAALLSARFTGKGQVVDAAICDGTASLLAMLSAFSAQGQWAEKREANLLDGGAPFYRTFECADGKHVAVGALEPKFYDELVRLTGFRSGGLERMQPGNWPALHARWQALFRTRSRDEWCALAEGSDACIAPVLAFGEAPAEAHLAARGTYVEIDGVTQPAPAPRFSATPAAIRACAPTTTTAEVLRRWQQKVP